MSPRTSSTDRCEDRAKEDWVSERAGCVRVTYAAPSGTIVEQPRTGWPPSVLRTQSSCRSRGMSWPASTTATASRRGLRRVLSPQGAPNGLARGLDPASTCTESTGERLAVQVHQVGGAHRVVRRYRLLGQ